ncbi:MAG: hypothetical protein EHM49_01235 [Deltaproteobacteria bacterium]|nr:MAG: hypothetical protein EHM49_01235 [Deltaproteobacteria bacterium]
MKVNIDRHTLEISELLTRIRILEEGIGDILGYKMTLPYLVEKRLEKLLGGNEMIKLAFFLECPKCGLKYFGKPTEGILGEIEFREYPESCPKDDTPLQPMVKKMK